MALTKTRDKKEFEYIDSDKQIWDIVYFETPERKYIQIKMRQEEASAEAGRTYDLDMLVELIKQLSDTLNPPNFNNLRRPAIVDYRSKSEVKEGIPDTQDGLAEMRTGVSAEQAPVPEVSVEVSGEIEEDIARRNKKIKAKELL